jgi:hypothetical protein
MGDGVEAAGVKSPGGEGDVKPLGLKPAVEL